MTANIFGRKVQAIRSDNGWKYTGKEIVDYLKNWGTDHQFTIIWNAKWGCTTKNPYFNGDGSLYA